MSHDGLISSFTTLIKDLSTEEEQSSKNSIINNNNSEERTSELFRNCYDEIDKLQDQIDKVKNVLNHPKVSLYQLEIGDGAIDDLICLISSQFSVAAQLRRDNHQTLVDKLKESRSVDEKAIEKSNSLLEFDIALDHSTEQFENQTSIYELPSDMLIHIGTFLFAFELLQIGLCNTQLFRLFFNQTPQKVSNLVKISCEAHFNYEKNSLYKNLLLDEQIEEYIQDESKSYSQVQNFIWKPLVCLYFPRFNKALHISNWMHTLRRRISHLKLFETKRILPLHQFLSKTDYVTPSIYLTISLIENCENIYQCPLTYDQLESDPTCSRKKTRICNICSKQVKISSSNQQFAENVKLGNCVGLEKCWNQQ